LLGAVRKNYASFSKYGAVGRLAGVDDEESDVVTSDGDSGDEGAAPDEVMTSDDSGSQYTDDSPTESDGDDRLPKDCVSFADNAPSEAQEGISVQDQR